MSSLEIKTSLTKKQIKFLKYFPRTVFCYIPDNNPELPTIHSEELDLTKQTKGYGTFFSVNGFSGGRRVSDNLVSVNAFYTDIDYPDKVNRTEEGIRVYKQDLLMELVDMDLPIPTYIIETKNGLHVYWCLENPVLIADLNPEQVEKLKIAYRDIQEAIIKRFDGDPAAKDIARVLRVPDTIHQKDPNNKFMIKIVHHSEEAVYSFQEIREKFLLLAPKSSGEVNTWAEANSERGSLTEEVKKGIEEKYPKLARPSMQKLMQKTGTSIPEGFRNKALLIAASACAEAGWELQRAYEYFNEYQGLPLREIRKTIKSAYDGKYDFGYNNEVMAQLVDSGERAKLSEVTSTLIAEKHKDQREKDKDHQKSLYLTYEFLLAERYPHLKYKQFGDFYDYKDGVYSVVPVESVRSMIVRQMMSDGLTNYRKASAVNDKLMCFKSIDGRMFTHEEENPNPNIMNVKNGLLNIQDYSLTAHTPDYLSTNQIPIEYIPGATCPTWEKFVSEIMSEEPDQVRLLQQIAGYCLTNSTLLAKAFIFHGMGANGKSLFTRILARVVGKHYVSSLNLQSITRQFGLGGLVGKKLNLIDEISGNYFDSNIIKNIISGELISADVKYRPEPLQFNPIAKLIFSVNEIPKINDTTPGLYRRFLIVPFERSFLSNPDITLESRLEAELPGILMWCFEGLKSLRARGYFDEGKKNLEALNSFRSDNSPLVEYITAYFEPVPVGREKDWAISVKDFYEAYSMYCRDSGYKPKSMVNLTKEIEHAQISNFKLGFDYEKDGKRVVVGARKRYGLAGERIIYNDQPT